METLENTRTYTYYKLIGYCRQHTVSHYKAIAFNSFFLFSFVALLLISIEFIYSHLDQLEQSLYALLQFITFLDIGSVHFALTLQKAKCLPFFKYCESMVNESEYRKKSFTHHE